MIFIMQKVRIRENEQIKGNKFDNMTILADMAKSLAMMADKLCGSEREDGDE